MSDQDTFLATMRARFAQDESDEFHIREKAREDIRFVGGKQWNEQVERDRELAGRPALTFNRLPTFIQQVCNESRQNKPSIKFSPVDNAGDVDTAKVFEGLARHVQYASNAQIAYDTAIEYAAQGGFGYFRLLTDFCKGTFDQEAKFGIVPDPFSVYGILIPKCFGRKPRHAFVIETLSDEEYEATYPDSEMSRNGFDGDYGSWFSDSSVRVAEYFWTVTKRQTIALIEGNSIVPIEQVPEGAGILRKRTIDVDTIRFCKTNGFEVFEGTETTWVGDCIPIFASLGRQMIIDGRPELFSLVRHQKHPQMLINAYKSGIAERIGMVNRAPYIGYRGQFTDPKWRSANVANHPYLEVDTSVVMPNGQYAPAPTRQNMESQIGDLSLAAAQEIDDLKAIAGIHDASLGQQGNETSGIAIARRQQQSSITNLHFIDNLRRAQEEAGTALAYILPRIYDTVREVRIVGEDETERVVRVNEPYIDPETGEEKTYMLDADKYDVKVNIGPAYTTKRQEASEQYAQVIQAAPDLMSVIGDIYFRNQDVAGSDEASERLKKFIQITKPGLIEDEKKQAEIPPQVQAQLQQSGQMIEQLTTALDETTKEVEVLKAKERIDLEKLQIERDKLQIHAQLELAKLQSAADERERDRQLAVLKAEIDTIKQRSEMQERAEQAEIQHERQKEQAAMNHQMQAEQAEQQAKLSAQNQPGDLPAAA